MRKKILWIAGIVIVGLMLNVGTMRYIEIQRQESDPNWQITKEIYKVENALREVDEGYECQSVTKVTPFAYTDTIVYYCIQTAYHANATGEFAEPDMDAVSLEVDPEMSANKRECTVNEYNAFLCEIEELTYLCWTLSPETSCVIAYSTDAAEAEIMRMAKIVPFPVR